MIGDETLSKMWDFLACYNPQCISLCNFIALSIHMCIYIIYYIYIYVCMYIYIYMIYIYIYTCAYMNEMTTCVFVFIYHHIFFYEFIHRYSMRIYDGKPPGPQSSGTTAGLKKSRPSSTLSRTVTARFLLTFPVKVRAHDPWNWMNYW